MSKHCTTCFNTDNELVSAEFEVVTPNKYTTRFCLAHLLEWIGYFYKKQNWPETSTVTVVRLIE